MAKNTVLLKDIAYDKIKESILNEEFPIGQFLSERELIEHLNMSKTPIKSALVRLETEGFVTVSSKQGIIINGLSSEKISDIYDLRIALEAFNCEQLVTRNTDEELRKLEENVEETKKCVEDLDVQGFTRRDHEFHLMICKFTENHEIYRVLLNYQDHLRRITLKHLRKDPNRMKQFVDEHNTIFQQLKDRDPQVVLTMKAHLKEAKRMYYL